MARKVPKSLWLLPLAVYDCYQRYSHVARHHQHRFHDSFGMFAFVFCQSAVMAIQYNRSFIRAEIAEKEVRTLNKDLEKIVEAKTREIKTILNNASSGFIGIDQDGRITPGFTKACQQLLPGDVQIGSDFCSVAGLDKRSKEHFLQSLDQVFEDRMPESVTLAQVPARIYSLDHYLSVDASAVRSSQGEVLAVLLTINDASSLVQAEKRIQENESLLSILHAKGFLH